MAQPFTPDARSVRFGFPPFLRIAHECPAAPLLGIVSRRHTRSGGRFAVWQIVPRRVAEAAAADIERWEPSPDGLYLVRATPYRAAMIPLGNGDKVVAMAAVDGWLIPCRVCGVAPSISRRDLWTRVESEWGQAIAARPEMHTIRVA